MTKAGLFAFLCRHRLGVLASISPDRLPQSALVGIAVSEDLEIVFDTVSTSRKYRNLLVNPECSFVIGWNSEATVQYEGRAYQPVGDELAQYKRAYFSQWPECVSHETWPDIAYFAVRAKWIRYSDYDQTPPLVEEWSFDAHD